MDIHKIIDEFYPFIKQLTWSDAIDIQRKFAAESHLARANSGKINQVLINLLNNSRDALLSRPFGRQIVIETISDGKCISIRFSDNGCGIPEAIINKIFDPFFTTKEVGKGTGLGLAISRVIIESFGGTLKASSKQGVGTTFEITLLCAQPPAAAG